MARSHSLGDPSSALAGSVSSSTPTIYPQCEVQATFIDICVAQTPLILSLILYTCIRLQRPSLKLETAARRCGVSPSRILVGTSMMQHPCCRFSYTDTASCAFICLAPSCIHRWSIVQFAIADALWIAGGAITDLAPLADLAHGAGVPLIVDNTMATPVLTRPFEHGADIICHSTVSFFVSLHCTIRLGSQCICSYGSTQSVSCL